MFFEDDDNLLVEITKKQNTSIWVEKYRPYTLDNYIGSGNFKSKMQSYINTNDIPNLLFYGDAGVGKSTIAKILIHNINCDYLYINASDENGIDVIRNKISNFVSTVGFRSLKVVVLEEADFLSPAAQAGLRQLIEDSSHNARFILTCNYVHQIIKALISRFQHYELTPPSKKDVAIFAKHILDKEQIKYIPKTIATYVDISYPDIRQTIHTIQQNISDNELIINETSIIDSNFKMKILDILSDKSKNKKTAFNEIRQILTDNSVRKFDDIYSLLYDKVDDYAKGNVASVIIVIADSQYKASFVVDKEIMFCSMIIQILDIIKE